MIQDSKNVQKIKQEAYNVATQTGGEIGSEHLLAGIVVIDGSIANNLLKLHGVTLSKIQNCFHAVSLKTEPYYSVRTKRILSNAQVFAAECGEDVVGICLPQSFANPTVSLIRFSRIPRITSARFKTTSQTFWTRRKTETFQKWKETPLIPAMKN